MSALMRVLYYLMILVDGHSYVYGPVWRMNVLWSRCMFLMSLMFSIYAFPILVVVSYMLLQYSMCGSYVFFVSSFWLKLGSDINCQPNFSL